MSEQMIQSNAIRGGYLDRHREKTIREIHDDMVTVFGPGAADAFITKDGQPYFTRDGKEVLASLQFDNPLSMYILKILYQAVADQAKAVGDGTTTLAVLYTNLMSFLLQDGIVPERKVWNKMIDLVTSEIRKRAVPMSEADFKRMLVTCTQDVELSAKIFHNLKEPIMEGAYITVSKSNIETDFVMNTHDSPVIKATLQFSAGPFHGREERCIALHCDGNLDITHVETLLDLMSQVPMIGSTPDNAIPRPNTIVIFCNSVTQATRETIKRLNQNIDIINTQMNGAFFQQYNNLAVFTMSEYRSFSAEQREDISTIITDEIGIGGLVNDLSFESLLYQCFHNPGSEEIPELKTFDHDISHIDKMRNMVLVQTPYPIEYDKLHGVRLEKPLGPVAQARYDDLRKQLEEEKSEVIRVGLMRRLKTMYGKFIDIEVGSKLIKDSQLKYELIVDAVVSASEAVDKGVLQANSLLIAYQSVTDLMCRPEILGDGGQVLYAMGALQYALYLTINDMIESIFDSPINDIVTLNDWISDARLDLFDLNRMSWHDVLPKETDVTGEMFTTASYDIDSEHQFAVDNKIVEPVSIICRMLENSSLALDLIRAKTIHVSHFMENYI